MKSQYFGDVKDLFKYDIVEWIITRIPCLDRFTFITMLTPDDNGGDGEKRDFTDRVGALNLRLVEHLKGTNKRDVSEIRPYYLGRGMDIHIYGEKEYFTNRGRGKYFADIEPDLLRHSLVFVDPDNGLEVKHSNHRHLLYREAADLFERMGSDSVLVLFQHFRREKRPLTVAKVASRIEATCGARPVCVHDGEAALFFLTKASNMHTDLVRVLGQYQQAYPRLNLQKDFNQPADKTMTI
jgi:hypothetical protein